MMMCIGNIGNINRGVPITDIKLTIYATELFLHYMKYDVVWVYQKLSLEMATINLYMFLYFARLYSVFKTFFNYVCTCCRPINTMFLL